VAKQVELRRRARRAPEGLPCPPERCDERTTRASVDIANRHMVPLWKAAALTAGNWGPKLAESIRARSDRATCVERRQGPARHTRGGASTNMVRYPAFMGTRNDWAPFGKGTGWMSNRRPYQAQAIREWGQATDRIVTKWNRSTL
jgi:hypothetical protein